MIAKTKDGLHVLLGDGDVLIGHRRWPDNERHTMVAFHQVDKHAIGAKATAEDQRAAPPPGVVIEFKDLAAVQNLLEHLFELRNGFEGDYVPRAVEPFSERQAEINKVLEREQLAVDLDTGTLTDEQRRVLELRFGVRIDPHHNFVRSRYIQLLDDGPVPPLTFAIDPGSAGRVLVNGKPMSVADALNYVLRVAMEPPRWQSADELLKGKVLTYDAGHTYRTEPEETERAKYVNQFLATLTHADDQRTSCDVLFNAYIAFCASRMVEEAVTLSQSELIYALRMRGYQLTQRADCHMLWKGVGLLPQEEDSALAKKLMESPLRVVTINDARYTVKTGLYHANDIKALAKVPETHRLEQRHLVTGQWTSMEDPPKSATSKSLLGIFGGEAFRTIAPDHDRLTGLTRPSRTGQPMKAIEINDQPHHVRIGGEYQPGEILEIAGVPATFVLKVLTGEGWKVADGPIVLIGGEVFRAFAPDSKSA